MKNQAILRNLGLKGREKYYYLRYGNLGTATVCVIPVKKTPEEIWFVRGVAFCNPKDQFNRKVGRAIALGRAMKAIQSEQFTDPIPPRTPALILQRTMGWAYLSCWDITLTEYEAKIICLKCTEENPCCDRRGEYNGFGSDGPLKFVCPKHCMCHD